jgi:hypothetical protein
MTHSLFFMSIHSPMTKFQNQFPVNTALLVAQADRVSSCGVQVAQRNFIRFLRCSCGIQTSTTTAPSLTTAAHSLNITAPSLMTTAPSLTCPTSHWETWQPMCSAAALPLSWHSFGTPSNVIVSHAMTGLNNLDANLHASSSTPDRNEWSASCFVHFRHKENSPW